MIFLGYSFKDKERLLPLVKALEAERVELWLDQNEVGLGGCTGSENPYVGGAAARAARDFYPLR